MPIYWICFISSIAFTALCVIARVVDDRIATSVLHVGAGMIHYLHVVVCINTVL